LHLQAWLFYLVDLDKQVKKQGFTIKGSGNNFYNQLSPQEKEEHLKAAYHGNEHTILIFSRKFRTALRIKILTHGVFI
jgi:hypothetical protein